MHEIKSRQDKTRELLNNFEEGNIVTSSQLAMSLYPKELDRFKGEFPLLSFKIIRTFNTDTGKKHEVEVERKHNKK